MHTHNLKKSEIKITQLLKDEKAFELNFPKKNVISSYLTKICCMDLKIIIILNFHHN